MYTLGIYWEQNSGASLFKDGELLGAVSQERFSRVKNDERYPKDAIEWLLSEHGVKPTQLSSIPVLATNWSPGYTVTRHYTSFSVEDYVREQKEVWFPRLYEGRQRLSQIEVFNDKLDLNQFPGVSFWENALEEFRSSSAHPSDSATALQGRNLRASVVKYHLNITAEKIHFVDHSFAHACYAFFSCVHLNDTSPRLVITLDAFGDFVNYSAYVMCRGHGSDRLFTFEKIVAGGNSIIARLYRYVTLILGLKPNEHEYKLMGISPYCKPKYYQRLLEKFRNFQYIQGARFVDGNPPRDMYFSLREILEGERFDTICGALQAYTEEMVVKWVENLVDMTGVRDVCYAGGVAMNVKANMLIASSPKISSLWVPPTPDDTSQAIGVTYAHLANRGISAEEAALELHPIRSAYLGRNADISRDDLDDFLSGYGLRENGYDITIADEDDIIQQAALSLSEGMIMGRCIGREEFGARALGNRSILCDPRNHFIKKRLNEKIKDRDFWMPFAATIIDSYSEEYLALDTKGPGYAYMTLCANSNHPIESSPIQAALHPYDSTCRPQLLSEMDNPSYYALIEAFGKITGVGALLNTSFNIHGKPIISTVEDAIEVFRETDLDGLILRNAIIRKIVKS